MAEYKIGAFAKNLGVTSSLLKHYEKYRLIQSNKDQGNGYRYYKFTQTPAIYRIKQLQRMGFTLREIASITEDCSIESLHQQLGVKISLLDQEIREKQLLLQEMEHIHRLMDRIVSNKFAGWWTIEELPSYYFLPHSHEQEFIHTTPAANKQLKAWIEQFPLTRQCALVSLEHGDYQHGLSVSSRTAERLGLPLGHLKPIELPESKSLVYHDICSSFELFGTAYFMQLIKQPLQILRQMNLSISGPIQVESMLDLTEAGQRKLYYTVRVPLESL